MLSSFSGVIGTALLFIVLFFAFRIILGLVAKLITKALGTKTLDKILGAIVGIVGGIAAVFLFAFISELMVSVVSIFDANADIIHTINDTMILKYFMM